MISLSTILWRCSVLVGFVCLCVFPMNNSQTWVLSNPIRISTVSRVTLECGNRDSPLNPTFSSRHDLLCLREQLYIRVDRSCAHPDCLRWRSDSHVQRVGRRMRLTWVTPGRSWSDRESRVRWQKCSDHVNPIVGLLQFADTERAHHPDENVM